MLRHSSRLVTGNDWQRSDDASLRFAAHAADVSSRYDGFDAVGLQYGPGYRTLAQTWGGASDALARLRARSTHEGTQVHPADLDDAVCTSAVVGVMAGTARRVCRLRWTRRSGA